VKTVDDFATGDFVFHIPSGETGIVSSKNLTYVFVKFSVMASNGKACYPNDLEKI
jgi:hypothetical protein